MKSIKAETIIRTVLTAIALLNQVITLLGLNPLPWSEDAMYQALTAIATAVTTFWAWYKNNSITQAAIRADEAMHAIKEGRDVEIIIDGEPREK